jgi:hypothetical protein
MRARATLREVCQAQTGTSTASTASTTPHPLWAAHGAHQQSCGTGTIEQIGCQDESCNFTKAAEAEQEEEKGEEEDVGHACHTHFDYLGPR